MNKELKEIKRRLQTIQVCQNGFVRVDDVKEVIAFIEGLMYVKENKDGTENQ